MKPGEAAAMLVRWWTALYTTGLGAGAKAERRAEVASDVFEHGRDLGWSARAGLEIALRWLLGVPADLSWRLEQATVGARVAAAANGALGRLERAGGWVTRRGVPGLTAVLVWLYIGGGVLVATLAPFQAQDRAGMAVLGAWAIVAGLAVRWGRGRLGQRPLAGFGAVLAGALPLGLVLMVTVVAPLLSLAVTVAEGRRAWQTLRARRREPGVTLV